jgi:hypothetical protein
MIPGKIVRTEEVGERKEITSAALLYEEPQVPLEYKTRINQFFSNKK